MRAMLVLGVLAALALPARALACGPYDDRCGPWDSSGLEWGISAAFSPAAQVGNDDLSGGGGGALALYRIGRVAVGADYDALFGNRVDRSHVTLHHVGAVARVLVHAAHRKDTIFYPSLWLRVGVGHQWLVGPGAMDRTDGELGFDAQETIVIGATHIGMYFGVEALLARSPTGTRGRDVDSAVLVTFGMAVQL